MAAATPSDDSVHDLVGLIRTKGATADVVRRVNKLLPHASIEQLQSLYGELHEIGGPLHSSVEKRLREIAKDCFSDSESSDSASEGSDSAEDSMPRSYLEWNQRMRGLKAELEAARDRLLSVMWITGFAEQAVSELEKGKGDIYDALFRFFESCVHLRDKDRKRVLGEVIADFQKVNMPPQMAKRILAKAREYTTLDDIIADFRSFKSDSRLEEMSRQCARLAGRIGYNISGDMGIESKKKLVEEAKTVLASLPIIMLL